MKHLVHTDNRQKADFYLKEYERLFDRLVDSPVNLLELGVYRGDSLIMWKKYFTNGNIIGLDLSTDSVPPLPGGIKIYQGDQKDAAILDKIRAENAPAGFDIIIDDASHIGDLTRKSFWHLFDNHLKPGGIYCVEDWGTGYWSGFEDGKDFVVGQPHFAGMVGFVKELVDECGIQDALHARKSKFERIQISLGQAFVFKAYV